MVEISKALPLTDAVEQVIGERMSYATLFRWTQRGLLTPAGDRVRLEFLKIGGRRRTSLDAVQRFVEAATEAAIGAATLPAQTPRARAAAVSAAERELEEIGV